MASGQLNTVTAYLRRLAGSQGPELEPDAVLLQRFTAQGDHAAFAVLVRRHGPLVWQVCRRVLGNDDDADDSFQATFLLLADRGASVRKRASLRSWLYGVAYRVAARARAQATRRHQREGQLPSPPASAPPDPALEEVRAALHEEVSRLPERLRAPVLLCYFEGLTNDEAARRLGCPRGTVATHLARARKTLGARLARRGLAVSAAALAAALSAGAAPAGVRTALLAATLRAVRGLKGSGPTAGPTLALKEGISSVMLTTKFKAALLLAVGALAVLPVSLWWFARADEPAPAPPRADQRAPAAAPRRPAVPKAAALIAALNAAARRVQTFEAAGVAITVRCRQQSSELTLAGRLAFQRPGNFRLVAEVFGRREMDTGGNAREFWLWVRQSDPPFLLRHTRAEVARGSAKWPVPFAPDWLPFVLGLGERPPTKGAAVVASPQGFELVEPTPSPLGGHGRRVTILSGPADAPRAVGYRLEGEKGKVLCTVAVLKTQRDQPTGLEMPQRLRLTWPADQIQIDVRLGEIKVNAPLGPRAARLFAAPTSATAPAPEVNAPKPAPAAPQESLITIGDAKITVAPGTNTKIIPVKTEQGGRIRIDLPGVSIEAPRMRLGTGAQVHEIEATADGHLRVQSLPKETPR